MTVTGLSLHFSRFTSQVLRIQLTRHRCTFVIQVGTPGQSFRILPATNGNEVWVPLPQGCASIDGPNCGDDRGVNLFGSSLSNGFQSNQSSTWSSNGIFDLIGEKRLNETGNGQYGFDIVEIGPSTNSFTGLQLPNQVVAGIATDDFYLGEFGLGPKPPNFTNTSNSPSKSFMRTLADQSLIPSLSFGYTAGAKYRFKSVFGSLTLGGYDASRFTPNSLTFTFGPDDSRPLLVGVQAVTAANTLTGNVTPLSSGILALIDSGTPHIWLPLPACMAFERAFGLTYDPHTDLYLVNGTTHVHLTQLNPSITFTLGNEISNGQNINITLPYASFDLQASHPIYENATLYFPLRRAANESQHTLGRTFLQEAYLTVDYTRSNFSVQQAIFQDPMPTSQIRTIDGVNPIGLGAVSPYHAPSRWSIGTILGLVFPIVTISVLLATLIIGQRRRDRKIKELEKEKEMSLLKLSSSAGNNDTLSGIETKAEAAKDPAWLKPELANDSVQPIQQLASRELPLTVKIAGNSEKQELNGSEVAREIDGGAVYEMEGGEDWVREMPGSGNTKKKG